MSPLAEDLEALQRWLDRLPRTAIRRAEVPSGRRIVCTQRMLRGVRITSGLWLGRDGTFYEQLRSGRTVRPVSAIEALAKARLDWIVSRFEAALRAADLRRERRFQARRRARDARDTPASS